jgi:thiol:disulfide interchange protein
VKVSLGFVELALALKFFSIADLVEHWHILNRDRFLVLWILIFFILALYLFGIIKFSQHDKGPVGGIRKIIAAIILLFVVYLGSGFFGGSLKEISGYIPPMDDSSSATDKLCNTPKYNDLLHLPLNLQGYFDYKEALACAKERGKPLFIDFTGHSCANCREVENNVWADPSVWKRLDQDFVIVALYYDESAQIPENEWYTSPNTNKLIKTVGKRNNDFQKTRFKSIGAPYYVILDPNTEKELTQPIAYERDIDTFIDFLEEGKTNFKKLNAKF